MCRRVCICFFVRLFRNIFTFNVNKTHGGDCLTLVISFCHSLKILLLKSPWHQTREWVVSACLSHFLSAKQHHGVVLVLTGTVSAAGPRGYVPGKDFTAVTAQYRHDSSQPNLSYNMQYFNILHWDVLGLGICAGGFSHVLGCCSDSYFV